MSNELLYNCHYPNCTEMLEKALIEFHHVTPKEINSSKRNKLTISLCPKHHKLIYCPESKHGQHALNLQESIEILNIYNSTAGKALHYKELG